MTLRPGEIALVAALGAMALIAWTHPAQLPLSVGASLTTVALFFTVAALALGEADPTSPPAAVPAPGGVNDDASPPARAAVGWRYWARELLPVPVVPFIFLNLGRLIPLVNSRVFDAELETFDRALLGRELQLALYSIPLPAWLSDLLTLAYSTFFFLPLVLLVTLARKRDPFLPRVVAAVILVILVSYAGYFAVPAYGPRATVAQERYSTLPEGLAGAPLRDLLDHWEKTKTDAFPSGHTMVTLTVLYCARRRDRRLYNALLPVGALLIAATVLLTYHYLADLLAALPLTVAAIALAARLAGSVPRRA